MSVFGTNHNSFLLDYGKTLRDPKQLAAFRKAKTMANQRATANTMSLSLPGAGGEEWNNFDEFHAVRGDMERLLGNKYNVTGSIEGGGELNSRPLNGMGNTSRVGGGKAMNQLPWEPMEQDVNMDLRRRRLQSLQLDNAIGEAERAPRDRSDARVMTALDALRQMGHNPRESALYDQGTDNMVADSAEGAETSRFFEPRNARRRQIGQEYAVERAVAPARAAADSRIEVANVNADARVTAAERAAKAREETVAQRVQRLMSGLSQASARGVFGMTRGQPNPPPEELMAEAQALLSGGMAAPGNGGRPPAPGAQTGGGAAAPADGARRRTRNGGTAVYMSNGPDGPGWYEE